jgi:hypothetical protein
MAEQPTEQPKDRSTTDQRTRRWTVASRVGYILDVMLATRNHRGALVAQDPLYSLGVSPSRSARLST